MRLTSWFRSRCPPWWCLLANSCADCWCEMRSIPLHSATVTYTSMVQEFPSSGVKEKLTYFVPTICLRLWAYLLSKPHSVALALDPECFVSTGVQRPLTYILTVAALHRLSRSPLALRTQTGYQSYCCEFGVLSGWFAIQGGLLVVGALPNPVWSQLQPSSSGNTQCSPDLLWSFVLQIFNV